ncbi:rCG55251 [Rattus norvegicus]|uniref:RCG55251 n=1 Tax=Rattus norvegicus TaxID=10116 RepID=A6J811_RAT|nr:rCG55251 [Rattus norvegicus]
MGRAAAGLCTPSWEDWTAAWASKDFAPLLERSTCLHLARKITMVPAVFNTRISRTEEMRPARNMSSGFGMLSLFG